VSFAEQRASMAEDLARLEGLLRQAQEMARALEARATAAAAACDTETLADDAALARALGVARRVRVDAGALIRTVRETKGSLTSDE